MSFIKKKSLIILGIIAIVVVISFAITTRKKEVTEKNVVRIGYNIQSLNYSAVILAAEAELYKKNGLAVELFPFSSGKDNRLALAAGKIDVAFFNVIDALILIDAGVPVKIVAPVNEVTTSVFVRPDSNMQTLKDLKGKKLIAAAGASEYALRRAYDQEGLGDPNFEQVDVEKSFKEIALTQQKVVDIIPSSRSSGDVYSKAGAVVLPEWIQKGYDNKFLPHMHMMVQTKFLNEQPELVEKVINTIIDVQKMMLTSEDEAAQLVAQHMERESGGAVKFSLAEIKNSWHKDIRHVLWNNFSELVGMEEFLYKTKQIKNPLTLEQMVDFRFAKKLEQAQKEIYETKD